MTATLVPAGRAALVVVQARLLAALARNGMQRMVLAAAVVPPRLDQAVQPVPPAAYMVQAAVGLPRLLPVAQQRVVLAFKG